ncbi:MAG TPA: hypothetical protein VGR03_06590 [Candidatus Acidoferrum sp.]|nr:hypothetical protein [Candidatus Acidoferrum sp.]
MYGFVPCGRSIQPAPAHDATPVCLMHSRDPQKSDATFQKEFEAILEAARNGFADFTRFVFPRASYAERKFTAACVFSLATFTRYASFSGATFTQDANFFRATFTRDAIFFGATFTQKTRFLRAKFLGSAEFRRTHFRLDQELFPGPIFSLAEFSQLEAVIFYKTYLGQALFHNCDVSRVNFSSVEWRKRKGSGKSMVFEEEVDLEAAKDLKPGKDSPDERDFGLIAELYQQLKKNYDERKDYWTAGDFHCGEMEVKRLARPRAERLARLSDWLKSRARHTAWVDGTEKLVNRGRRWWHRRLSLMAWYKRASQYGESYARPALWLVTILFAFALLFPVAGLRYDPAKDPHAVSGAAQSSYVLTYWHPFPPGQASTSRHKAQWRLFGNSCVTALDVATFQRDRTTSPLIHGADCCSCWSYCSSRRCLGFFCWRCSDNSGGRGMNAKRREISHTRRSDGAAVSLRRQRKRDFSLPQADAFAGAKAEEISRPALFEMTGWRGRRQE